MYSSRQTPSFFAHLLAFVFAASCCFVSAAALPENNKPCKLSQWWLYQINTPAGQPYNVTALAESNADFIVVDYLHNGAASKLITPAELNLIRGGGSSKKGFQSKIILGYISAGEAEIYRYYWNPGWADSTQPNADTPQCNGKRTKGTPAWLLEPSSESRALWRVHFWHPQWIAVLNGYIGKISIRLTKSVTMTCRLREQIQSRKIV